jgi:hypothetical protein
MYPAQIFSMLWAIHQDSLWCTDRHGTNIQDHDHLCAWLKLTESITPFDSHDTVHRTVSKKSLGVCHTQIITSPLESYWIIFSTYDENQNHHIRDLKEYTGLFFCNTVYWRYDISLQGFLMIFTNTSTISVCYGATKLCSIKSINKKWLISVVKVLQSNIVITHTDFTSNLP